MQTTLKFDIRNYVDHDFDFNDDDDEELTGMLDELISTAHWKYKSIQDIKKEN